MSLLELDSVSVRYFRDGSFFHAVRDVSLTVDEGQTLALVGESGSGKSSLARAIVGLVPTASGTIRLNGRPFPKRGQRPVAMVFQDPLGSLDPRMPIGAAIAEVLTIHRLLERGDRHRRVLELLSWVGLPPTVAELRPQRLSGGQQQRAAIARALAAEPRILILDEPVSALDVSIRAQILRLLGSLRERLDISYLFIAHDLTVVRQLAERIAVMYRGRMVEVAPAAAFFETQLHPYSKALVSAVPSLRRLLTSETLQSPPTPSAEGCVYAHRCASAEGQSFTVQPSLQAASTQRLIACHHWQRDAHAKHDLAGPTGEAA